MNGVLYRALFLCGIVFCCAPFAFSDITVRHESSGRMDTVPTLTREGALLAAVPRFFEQLGFGWQWDASAQQLTCRRNDELFVFTQDVPFYRFDAAFFQLDIAPRRAGASLFLPIEALLAIVNASGDGNCRWNGAARVLTIDRSPHTILSVACEKRQNGALVTIALADSVTFDYAYSHPHLALNFSGATVDTLQIRSARPVGFIDSITASQSAGSARIAILLARQIQEPEIDYLQDLNTVLVSLRPKEESVGARTAAVPLEPATGGTMTIVIDPGHGGKDPGAIGPGGSKEKDLVLRVALHLRDALKKKSGIKLFLTRETDKFIPLADRTKMANACNADLFISIHANAMGGSRKKRETTRGYKVYFLSQAKNEEDKLVAMRENAVIELEDKPRTYGGLQNVLIDLAGNEYLRESQELCILLDQQFERSLRRKILKEQPGVGQANFWVLNGAYMPSILVEIGFLSHKFEEKVISDKSFQKEMAIAIADAVLRFKKKYETGL